MKIFLKAALLLLVLPITKGSAELPRAYCDLTGTGGGGGGGGGTSTITASLVASRTTCVSPCTVMFSAIDTVDTTTPDEHDIFSDLGYRFRFDDPTSGNHDQTGLTRNEQSGGPMATHTFECASGQCTFGANVRAFNTSGNYDDATVTITVDAASNFYAGTDTICVSTSSTFTGDTPCPAGASQVTQTPSPTAMDGKRVLFRRGETFNPICIDYASANVLAEPFGNDADARPIITGHSAIGVDESCGDFLPTDTKIASYPSQWAKNVTYTGMRMERISVGLSAANADLYDLDMDWSAESSGGVIAVSKNAQSCLSSGTLTCSNIPYARGVYISRVKLWGSISRATAATSEEPVNIGGFNCPMVNWIAVIDSDVKYGEEHNYRSEGHWRGNWAHNSFRGHHLGNAGNKHAITTRACGFGNIDPETAITRHSGAQNTVLSPMSRYSVIADNLIGSTDNVAPASHVHQEPTKDGDVEAVWDSVVERNTFIRNPADGPTFDISFRGGYLTARTDNTYTAPFTCGDSGQDVLPSEIYTVADCAGAVPPM